MQRDNICILTHRYVVPEFQQRTVEWWTHVQSWVVVIWWWKIHLCHQRVHDYFGLCAAPWEKHLWPLSHWWVLQGAGCWLVVSWWQQLWHNQRTKRDCHWTRRCHYCCHHCHWWWQSAEHSSSQSMLIAGSAGQLEVLDVLPLHWHTTQHTASAMYHRRTDWNKVSTS